MPNCTPVSFFALNRNALCLFLALSPATLTAGGPKYVAGSSYFQSGVMGQPLHWANGRVNYYVDQGPLSGTVTNQQATAMVDAAAALWSAVPTAGVTLVDAGSLNEDVNGANVAAGNQVFTQPADVASAAKSYPVGVVYDADGSVINALFGNGASDPDSCQYDGVMTWIDSFNPDATMAHGIILLNGLCADTAGHLEMMSFQLERAFGIILGLGYSQVNTGAATNGELDGMQGWPVMQPISGGCGAAGGNCIPNPAVLRFDDIAALNRIYPITAANLESFPGKELTAANTISIDGTITFRAGTGMQGVNVVARPLDGAGNPLYAYTVTFVSGSYFSGNHGSPVTGTTDANGVPLSQWGSTDAALQGYFDLRYMPLPPGATAASYQISFEAVNPLYIYQDVVGPYVDGSPAPSGTLAPVQVVNLAAGGSQTLAINVADSATGDYDDAIASQQSPRLLPASGLWVGKLGQVGQTDWFNFPVRANRMFTVVTLALDEKGLPTGSKAMPAIGIWDAFDAVGSASVGTAPALNGAAVGETWLQAATGASDDVVRLGISDMRGDGRPDYAYSGWVLYADTVQPQRLPVGGGPIVIRGMGFHSADTVLVGGKAAQVTSISPNEITAIAPSAATGVTGSVDVEVDDQALYYAAAVLSGGVSYDAGTGDSLTLVTAPANTVPIGAPIPFTVTALGSGLTPAGGVTVTFSVAGGTATLACGMQSCAVTATGDGSATMNVTAMDSNPSVVTASLTNGASLQAHFNGGTPAVIAALNPTLSVAAGASVAWSAQALVVNNGSPMAGQTVAWQTGSGITASSGATAMTSANGIATKMLNVGPLTEGTQATANACLNGTGQCVGYTVQGARAEYAYLEAVSGASQSMAVTGTPNVITLRVRDMNGNPMAGGSVTLYQSLYAWAPPCPPHGRCAQAELLQTQVSTAVSGLDGTVTLAPAVIAGVPTNMVGLAATGDSSTLGVAVELHP